jgi:hypothetical protein
LCLVISILMFITNQANTSEVAPDWKSKIPVMTRRSASQTTSVELNKELDTL